MKLVIISGAETTGKSAIGRCISRQLGYSYLSKDVIKERLFDRKDVSTWRYGWYEKRAKAQLLSRLATGLASGENLVLESNFISKDKTRLEELLVGQKADITEVHCYALGFVPFVRFVKRNEARARHPGHHDRRWYIPVA